MSKREIAALACKILSLYTLIYMSQTSWQAFNELTRMGSLFFELASNSGSNARTVAGPNVLPDSIWRIVSGMSPFGLQLFLAITLWVKSGAIAERMVVEYPEDARIDVGNADVKGIAFATVGVLQIVLSLPNLLHAVLAFLWNAVVWNSPMSIPAQPYLILTLLHFLFGVVLVLQWHGILDVLRYLQNRGKPTPTAVELTEGTP